MAASDEDTMHAEQEAVQPTETTIDGGEPIDKTKDKRERNGEKTATTTTPHGRSNETDVEMEKDRPTRQGKHKDRKVRTGRPPLSHSR
jgi:hypothetical protein